MPSSSMLLSLRAGQFADGAVGGQWTKLRFDLHAARLQERGQREPLAVERAVDLEPRSVGRELEQHVIRLAHVDRHEVVTVHDAAVAVSRRVEALHPVFYALAVGNAQREGGDA